MKLPFDTIILINLERCADKYERMISRIESLGLDKHVKIIRLDAVDGTSINEEWLENNNIIPLADYYDSYRGRGLTLGEIGCAISHYRSWKMIHDDDSIQSALILEDDAQFTTDFLDKVTELTDTVKDYPWELFYLGRKRINMVDEEVVFPNIVKPEFSYWCLSYMVNKKGAEKLINGGFLQALIPADEYVPIMTGKPNITCVEYLKHYNGELLNALALEESIVKPETSAFFNSETEKTSVYFKNDFYEDNFDKFMLITVATEENDQLDRFRKSCEYYGVPYRILGLGEEWNGGEAENGVLKTFGGGQKINLLKKELKTWLDLKNHIVMFTDSYDVILLQNPQEIIRKFREFERTIVFSAEKTCWPDQSLVDEYPQSETEYRFLNSGGFIGYANEIYELIKDPIDDKDDDQLYYTQKYLKQVSSLKPYLIPKTEKDISDNQYPITESGHKIGWMSEPVFDVEVKDYLMSKFGKDSKVLDIGAGDGKWGYVLGDYFNNMDAVEIFETYIERYDLKKYYKNIFIKNFLEFDFDHYDIIIMGDVFEHVTQEDAKEWLNKIKNKCKEIVVVVPFEYEQNWDGVYENKWGHHHQPNLTAENMVNNFPELQLRMWVDKSDSVGKGNGFGLFTKKFGYDHRTVIFLDTNQYIFQTLNKATDDIEVDLVGKIKNKVTNNFPSMIHANGPSDVKKFLDTISDYMTGNYDFAYGNKSTTVQTDSQKTVSIGMFFHQDVSEINQCLDQLRILKYPKNKISLSFYYSKPEDLFKLEKFKTKNTDYNSIQIKHIEGITDAKIDFLKEENNTDYYLIMDSNYIFRNVRSLEILIGCNKKIISPMIVAETNDYSNFHIKEIEIKKDYLLYEKKGIWSVEILSGIILIDKDFVTNVLDSLVKVTPHTDGDWDVKLSENLKNNGYFLYICNNHYFGSLI